MKRGIRWHISNASEIRKKYTCVGNKKCLQTGGWDWEKKYPLNSIEVNLGHSCSIYWGNIKMKYVKSTSDTEVGKTVNGLNLGNANIIR